MINSPLEQFELNSLNMGMFTFLDITTFTVYIFIVYILYRNLIVSNRIVGTRWSMAVDSMYSMIYSMVISQIGKNGEKYFPMVYSLFVFIVISNLISMVPYNLAINGQLVFTVSLSITLWLSVTIIGLKNHRFEYFGLFIPSGTGLPLVPLLAMIETISNIARSISLGLRLGANVLSGHLLLIILCGLVFDFMAISWLYVLIGIMPLVLVVGIVGLEFAISIIQGYVFCILLCSYLNEAVNLH